MAKGCSKYPNIWHVTQLSIGFFVLYCAFNSSQNIQSIILEQDGYGNLGFYSLGVQALFQGLGSLLSSWLLNLMGLKPSMVLGAFMNSLWVLQGIIPALKYYDKQSDSWFYSQAFYNTINILISAISGFFGCLLWVGEGKYISDCATEDTKGFYFGYFWMIYMNSQIFGNLIASLILGKFDQVIYFAMMSLFAFTASASFAFLRKPKQVYQELKDKQEGSQHIQTDLIEINRSHVSSLEIPSRDNGSNVEPAQEIAAKSNFKEDIRSVWKMSISKRMRYFLPQLLWIGVSIAIYSGLLVPIISLSLRNEDDNTKTSKALLAMVAFGFGEIIGGVIIGYIVDHINSKIASIYNSAFVLATIVVTLIYINLQEYNWFVFFMAFLWGVQDGSVNTHCLEMLGFEFENNTVPFSIFSMFEAIAVFVFQIIQSFVKTDMDYALYIGITGFLGAIMCATTYFFDFKENRSHYNN